MCVSVCVQETKLHPTMRGRGGGGVELETCFKLIVREGGGERGWGEKEERAGGGGGGGGERTQRERIQAVHKEEDNQ